MWLINFIFMICMMAVLGANKVGSEIDEADRRIYKDDWGIYWINCRNDGVCWKSIDFEVLMRLVGELMKLIVNLMKLIVNLMSWWQWGVKSRIRWGW